jgi:hypothetical protein
VNRSIYLPLILAALMCLESVEAADKAPAAKDTVVLQRVPVPGTGREMGMVAYVLEGEVTVQVDGQPTRVVHAGESYRMPANVVHVTTAGPAGAKVIATWAWVPGKPFNILVPN